MTSAPVLARTREGKTKSESTESVDSGLVVLDVFDLRQLHGWYAKEITFGPTDADDMNLKAHNNQSTKRLIVTDSFYSTVSLSLKLLNMG
ncbi:hypothetical protein F441_13821 [Phytophthora nicotianae CJ01A1]|uniref:PiggyBac transposable element-derived protein domain-containing protein n=2 Tax=Phytophthora nicotianae TaxID=4792 RepID=W2XYH4_PHYNI|nr:hypothetical protein F441_13821 [Phytophthora nicotianae CJ01A1]ETP27582.1 hypothetical protein F442_23141 [Phytophthora nicotianae P10297]ETP38722.1 hypothetical protein F442_13730 [Phytophthora nicotianae P10297]